MKNRLSLLVLMLTFICLAASGQKNNNTPQSPTPTEISLQDSIQSLRADNADLRKQLDKMEKEVEKYRWDFGQTVNDYNDKMSLWLAIITIIIAIVSVGGTYFTNKWSEKYIEKLLKSADEKAEKAQAKAEEVVVSVTADAKSAKEHAKNAEGFVNAVKEQAEKAEGILSTAKVEAEKSLTVVNELKTQIVNELTPLKETATKSEALLNSIQEYFEKIKNSQVDNTTNIDKQQIQKEDNHEEAKNKKQQDQIELIKRVKYSDDKKTILNVPNGIEHFNIPEGVTEIGMEAFYGCTSLTSIEIPISVTKIGDSAFMGCSNLTSIVIPYKVTEIGSGAFVGCTGIKNYIISKNSSKYCSIDGALYSKDKAKLIRVPCDKVSFEIPKSVTVIGDYAFESCTSLTSIEIPDSVTEIGEVAFADCTSLSSIEISDSVNVIGNWTFANCNSLPSIVIPDSVTKIGYGAFRYCTSLTEIHLKHTSPVDFSKAFPGLNLSKITIYVPKGSLKSYKDSEYYSRFKEIKGE